MFRYNHVNDNTISHFILFNENNEKTFKSMQKIKNRVLFFQIVVIIFVRVFFVNVCSHIDILRFHFVFRFFA